MFRQITREEYIILGEAGVKVSAWSSEREFRDLCGRPHWIDDYKLARVMFEMVKQNTTHHRVFYAIVDDELDANPTE
jgi:hypothetical protein